MTSWSGKQNGQALLEGLLVLGMSALLFAFVAVFLRLATSIWLHHQTNSLGLCVLDGVGESICRLNNSQAIARLTPWVRQSTFRLRRNSTELTVETRWTWPNWLVWINTIVPLNTTEQVTVRFPLYLQSPSQTLSLPFVKEANPRHPQ